MIVPAVDLALQHECVAEDVRVGWASLLDQADFILGGKVNEFEAAFAAFSGVEHCVGVASGTDAIEMALRALGVGPRSTVVLPVNTFIATALAVVRAGATPVLVDVDEESLLMDEEQAIAALDSATGAVIPVHLYGQVAPTTRIFKAARGAGVPILEDAAQAHGARDGDAPAGALGVIAATSFYPTKNLGAYGDAGAVLTSDSALAARVRSLRDYGRERPHVHSDAGWNSRLDTLQAVVLLAKLKHLARWNEDRRVAAGLYEHQLGDVDGLRLPVARPGTHPAWHLYVVRVRDRDRVLADLREAGIEAAVHYPTPIHLQPAFRNLGYLEGAFPIAERAVGDILSLPLFPGITTAQQEYVSERLRKSLAS